MKTCIWCNKNEAIALFEKLDCNHFFGNHFERSPSVETILKETFNIARIRLTTGNNIGKNKSLSKISSIYFKVNLKKRNLELKPAYRLQRGFQEGICRQMKKGIYKLFLEETERQHKNGHDSKFDFIREFARYNIGDYPVFYFERTNALIAITDSLTKHPEFFIDPEYQFKYLVNKPNFFEFELLGQVFGIATSRHWKLTFEDYFRKSMQAKSGFFHKCKIVSKFNDVDLALSTFDSKR